MSLLTNGNTKVKALLFDLPTSVCSVQCNKCYARKAEVRFPNVRAKREKNYEASLRDDFSGAIIGEISRSSKDIVRPHSSGDFYSQEYIDKWYVIMSYLPETRFYAYTKNRRIYDFSRIEALRNFNLIDSTTPLGYNYGDGMYCHRLVMEYGYYLCGCQKGHDDVGCMTSCFQCLTQNKVCFLEH